MKKLNIALDIDGVITGGKHKEWDWSDPETYSRIPPMNPNPGRALAKLASHDIYYCTGRPRFLNERTVRWLWKYVFPQFPIYHCTGQKNKPAWLALLQPDVVIDDNPNVILGYDNPNACRILIHDPDFHTWELPEYWPIDTPIVRNLSEAARVVAEVARRDGT